MINSLKKAISPLLPEFIKEYRIKKYYEKWLKDGKLTSPPHFAKQLVIREYREKYHCKVFIETGTFMGDMVQAQKNHFSSVISIELAPKFFHQAVKRFRNDKNVRIVEGDSGKVLPGIMATVTEPALFWLDGHYSAGETAKGDKECPIYEEIDAIFAAKKLDHVLLIDDARLFVGEKDYPTIEELTRYIQAKDSRYKLKVETDVIRYAV